MVLGLDTFNTLPIPPSLMSMTVRSIGREVVDPMMAKDVAETLFRIPNVSTMGQLRSFHQRVLVSAVMIVHRFW
jgi:hypothetical protein